MANILEQQDLLKGLPDARLATLMQNPTGDIPPFLVAAEAQRRQAIRQQFSGGEQESVVDSLAKQLTSQNENIQAPEQPNPQMPQMQQQMPEDQMQQPQEGAGIDALQQGMRDGGMVRRFASAGYVSPTVGDISSGYYQDPFGIPDMSDGDTSIIRQMIPDLGLPPLFPEYKTPEQIAKEQAAARIFPKMPPGASAGMSLNKMVIPRDPNNSKDDTSAENQNPPAQEDEIQNELERLLNSNQVSDWEKAQKWFAASQELVKPGQTTMQALVGAAGAFGQGAAEQAKAEREAKFNAAKGILEYKMSQRDAAAAAAAKVAADEMAANRALRDKMTPSGSDIAKGYLMQAERLRDALNKDEDPKTGAHLSPEARKNIVAQIRVYENRYFTFLKNAGYSVAETPTMEEINALTGQ